MFSDDFHHFEMWMLVNVSSPMHTVRRSGLAMCFIVFLNFPDFFFILGLLRFSMYLLSSEGIFFVYTPLLH